MNKEFTIYTKINKKVFKQFSFFNSFILDRKFIPIILFPVAMLLTGIFFTVKHNTSYATTMFCLAGLYTLGYTLIYQKGIRQQISRFNLEDNISVYTLECDSNGVSIFNDTEKTRLLWNEIHMLYMYKENFYLYVTPKKAFLMPFKDIVGGSSSELLEFFKEVLPAEKIRAK